MEIDQILELVNRSELRDWLEKNSDSANYCWVIVSIRPETGKLHYLDVVEEALCFGWIDGIKKKTHLGLVQRLSPRSKKSQWTELNKERVRRLEKLGLMTNSGRQVLPNMELTAFLIDKSIETKLKENSDVYVNFLAFPDLYKRIRIDTIQSNPKHSDLFEKRLIKFIENTKTNTLYGAWNDDGRLIDY
ncbi:YdeI/OmpD-associated family protein [Carnobacterium gallinarum]|uniref:YdeI/OmpD-associated family protein n=1 Tax=Carnobacterium gallinarum TaxID=2749 RepID=UPI00054D3B3A|nr:YdeI/OmpD-associated family protein [Carnobacterium gallinarum]